MRRGSGAHRASPSEEGSRTEYTLRRQLAEAGVPVAWIPERTADAYWIVEELVSRVRCAPSPDLAPGAVLVVAGAGADALATARQLQADLRLPADCVVAVGFDTGTCARQVDQRWEALALVAEVRQRREAPLVVAIDTDTADSAWATTMVAAFAPDVLWHVVDATRKPVDARLAASRLGRRVDALVVVNAARTASPASVWELETPIALVDGRRCTPGTWAVLLIDTLAALAG